MSADVTVPATARARMKWPSQQRHAVTRIALFTAVSTLIGVLIGHKSEYRGLLNDGGRRKFGAIGGAVCGIFLSSCDVCFLASRNERR